MRIRARHYQQFDADLSLEVPGEGYGGWRESEIVIAPEHTALVVMHAWDCGTPEQWLALGIVDQPSGLPNSDKSFYSNRYEYGVGLGYRGGEVDRPTQAHMLELLFTDPVVMSNGHGAPSLIQNKIGDSVTAESVTNYGAPGSAVPKLVFLKCCLAGQFVAPALTTAGVDCVVAFTGTTNSGATSWRAFVNHMCDEGKTAAEAYQEVCQTFPYDWTSDRTRIIGDTHLWGAAL